MHLKHISVCATDCTTCRAALCFHADHVTPGHDLLSALISPIPQHVVAKLGSFEPLSGHGSTAHRRIPPLLFCCVCLTVNDLGDLQRLFSHISALRRSTAVILTVRHFATAKYIWRMWR